MKFFPFIFLSVAIFISCQNETKVVKNTTAPVNDLLPTKAIVNSEVEIINENFPEWTSGFDSTSLKALTEKVLESKTELFEAMVYYDQKTETKADINFVKELMSSGNSIGIKSFYFIEDWFYNQSENKFTKEIISWSPVQLFYKESDNQEENKIAKRLLFDVRTGFTSLPGKKIASDVMYGVTFSDELMNYKGFNYADAIKTILEPALSGKSFALDFSTSDTIPAKDVKFHLGFTVDSIEVINPTTEDYEFQIIERPFFYEDIKTLIFVEDWYLDESSMAIRKEVKYIAPVRHEQKQYEDGEIEEVKKITIKIKVN
ncbi:MAG: hypothetical protein JXR60_06300 [Bacteroidales bacterium]|nr:hypothetical protein [Bacteroidales bacterium]